MWQGSKHKGREVPALRRENAGPLAALASRRDRSCHRWDGRMVAYCQHQADEHEQAKIAVENRAKKAEDDKRSAMAPDVRERYDKAVGGCARRNAHPART